MQDNGTRYSPTGENASATSNYVYGLGGDGFEVIWNNKDATKILGSVYNGQISRTLNGGTTWASATTGLNPSSTEFSFVTKLANSKNLPDRVFTVGTQGVYVSQDFGGQWQLTSIPNKFVISSPFYLDVEVSRANANIVWAGSGMNNTGTQRNLFVSKDGGATFSSTNNFTIVTLGNITKLASHPAEENTAYALFSFAHGPKILRTTDLGQTWEDISGFGTGSASTNGFPDVAVFCLYVRPDNPNILWAGTEIGIVESLDNGQTWALINDFPNVSVWDMKGQDDQVVIATHGRGIWTATIDTPQETVHAPEITASGTSPLGSLMVRIKSIESFDSLEVYIGTALSKTIKNISPGVTDAGLANISAGAKEIKVVGYKGNSPYQSQLYKMNHLSLLAAKNSYSTYFTSIADLSVNGLTLQSFPNTGTLHRQALQTSHPFSINSNNQIIIKTPVNFSASLPVLYYSDIAIIEPAADSVIVEATKNGLDWIRLAPAYDATYENRWMTAYSSGQPGTASMFKEHEINYSGKFSAGDVLLFRLRMVSGPTVTAWGWGLDYISIQVTPLAVENNVEQENISLYPNPTKGDLNIDYSLKKPSEVSLHVMDVFGRTVTTLDLGLKNSGLNSETINLNEQQPGTYMILLKTNEGKKASKIVLHR
jgi:photosystem II stability/assembly factor-like uncharacterized protein